MVPTLARKANLDAMPALDLLVVDEAHHVAADSYRRIIDRAQDRNPDVEHWSRRRPTGGTSAVCARCSRTSLIRSGSAN